MERQGIVSPVLEVHCAYRSMVHFGDVVEIIPRIEKYNGVTLELSYEILDKKTGEIRTTGSSKHCFLNREGRLLSLKRKSRCLTRHSVMRRPPGTWGADNRTVK